MNAVLPILAVWMASQAEPAADWKVPVEQAARLDALATTEDQLRNLAIGENLTINDLLRSPVDLIPCLQDRAIFEEPRWEEPDLCTVQVSLSGKDALAALRNLPDSALAPQTRKVFKNTSISDRLIKTRFTAVGKIQVPSGMDPGRPTWVGQSFRVEGISRITERGIGYSTAQARIDAELKLGVLIDRLICSPGASKTDQNKMFPSLTRDCSEKLHNLLHLMHIHHQTVSETKNEVRVILELDTRALWDFCSVCTLPVPETPEGE